MTDKLKIRALTGEVEDVISHAKRALERIGVEIESESVRDLLAEHGVEIKEEPNRDYPVAHITSDLVDRCVSTVPKTIDVYDRDGNLALTLGGDDVHFNPGSCAIWYHDTRTGIHRPPTYRDLVNFTRVADALPNIHMVSTAMNINAAHPSIQDMNRLRIVLKYSKLPVVTGTFTDEADNFERMKDMLVAIRGSEDELRAKPLAIFDCCPSPPLKWARVWSEDLVRGAKYGIITELISMPQPGLSGPVSFYGSLVQHTAETLSGIVISQLANPGAPIIYGGSPTMVSTTGEALLGDIGVGRFDIAYVSVAKYFGLPCQAYLGLSDSKTIDVQSGFEKGPNLMLAALAGVNNVSAPGMLYNESCQSPEQLVIDDELCGAVLYACERIQQIDGVDPVAEIDALVNTKGVDPDTVQYLRDQIFVSTLAERDPLERWCEDGKRGMRERAMARVDQILSADVVNPLDEQVAAYLDSCVRTSE